MPPPGLHLDVVKNGSVLQVCGEILCLRGNPLLNDVIFFVAETAAR